MESEIGTQVGTISTEDHDQGINGTVIHSIIGGEKQQNFPFKLESDGKLIIILDMKKISKNRRLPDRIIIKASDLGNPPKNSISTLFLHYFDSDSYLSHKDFIKKSSETPNINTVSKQKNKNKSSNDNAHWNANISDSMMLLYCLAAILFFVFIIVFSVLLYIYCTKVYPTSEGYTKKLYKSNNSHINSNTNMKELQQMTMNSGEIHECHSGKNEDGAAVCFLNDDGSCYTHLMMLTNNKYTLENTHPGSQNSFTRQGECLQPESMSISQSYFESTANNSPFLLSSPHFSKSSLKKQPYINDINNTMINCNQNYSTLQEKLTVNSSNKYQNSCSATTVDKQNALETSDLCRQQKELNSPYVISSFV